MAKHILNQGYCIELRQVCPQQDAQLQQTHVLFDRCNTVTQGKLKRLLKPCQKGLS